MRRGIHTLILVVALFACGLILIVGCEGEVKDDPTEPGSPSWCDERRAAGMQASDDCSRLQGRVAECRLREGCRAGQWCPECEWLEEQEFKTCEVEQYLWESVIYFCSGGP
jgi:hypothetical protein